MTLFERLRDIVAYEEANPGSTTYDAEAVVWGSLPAVVNLLEAARQYREVVERMVATQDPAELKPAWQRFTDAHDVFGEEPK